MLVVLQAAVVSAVAIVATEVVVGEQTNWEQTSLFYDDDEFDDERHTFSSPNSFIHSFSSRLCPFAAGCSPPSMSSIVVCLLLS